MMRCGEYRHDVFMCNSRFQINHNFQAQVQHDMIRVEVKSSRRFFAWPLAMMIKNAGTSGLSDHSSTEMFIYWIGKSAPVPLLVFVCLYPWAHGFSHHTHTVLKNWINPGKTPSSVFFRDEHLLALSAGIIASDETVKKRCHVQLPQVS